MSLIVFSAQKKTAGFTLIEMVLTIVILGFSAMIIIPFFSAITHSPDPVLREKAVALGQAMMDEIMAKRWDENSPVGGGPICTSESVNIGARLSLDLVCNFPGTGPVASTIGLLDTGEESGANKRALWDDVDDYDDVSEDPSNSKPFYDQDGIELLGNWTGFTRSVAVDYIASNGSSIDSSTSTSGTATDTKRIIVTVTSPLGETFMLVAVSCNI